MKARYDSARFARQFDRMRRLQGETEAVMAHIREICDLRGSRVVELGAGTGVMTERFAGEALSVTAFDRSPHMIALAMENLHRTGMTNCVFGVAEHSRIPLPAGCADVVIAAWALDSVVFDSARFQWRAALDRIVLEMGRLTRSGGTIVIVAAPLRGERDYLGILEAEHGFQRRLFRSPWRFPSRCAAREAITFFLREQAWRDYEPHWPRCFAMPAGIWWRVQQRSTGAR